MWIVTDCSRSGDFRSLTSHFRKRRSTAYSEPGESHHDPTVSAATEASNDSTPSHDTANEVGGQRSINLKVELGKISTQVMDIVDRRIEGVEETMVTMNRAIRRLTRKVVSCVVTTFVYIWWYFMAKREMSVLLVLRKTHFYVSHSVSFIYLPMNKNIQEQSKECYYRFRTQLFLLRLTLATTLSRGQDGVYA